MNVPMKALALVVGIMLPWLGAHATQESADEYNAKASDQAILAAKARQAGDLLLASVKSPVDLATYLRSSSTTPLDALSPAAKARFLNSLSFNEGGLTGFDYSDLRAELTATQVYRILAIFGAQRLTPLVGAARADTDLDRLLMVRPLNTTDPAMEDQKGYRCESPHTCGESLRHICMSGC